MKKTVFIIAIAAGILAGAAFAKAGDVTETRDLSSFEKIIIDGTAIGLDIMVGKDFSVTLTGPEKWVARIITNVENNALVLSRIDKKKNAINIDSDNRVIITMPKFTGLKVKGAVDAKISDVDSDKLDFAIDGAGNIEITGKCRALNIELNGAGNFEGEDLKCKDINVEINGAGNVEVYGSISANLDINGMGNIDLYGNPKEVNKDSGWFSNITVHEDK